MNRLSDTGPPPSTAPAAEATAGVGTSSAPLTGAAVGRPPENTDKPSLWRGPLSPKILLGTLSVVTVIGLYWIYTVLPTSNQVLTPPPPKVLEALIDGIVDGSLFEHIFASLNRVLIGFFIGVALAILMGCTAGWFRTAGYLLDPIIEAIRPIPALAYIPLVIVWLGIDEPSRIVIIVLAVFKPCVVNTRQGMKEIPNIYVEAAESLGASKIATFWRVAIPNAIPFIMSGMRTGLATGFLALVAAELIASSNGLGFLISNAGQNLRIDIVLMGIVVIGIVATILDAIAVRIQRYLTRWSEVRQ